MVAESGVFAMHLLAAGPEPALQASLEILMGLGGSSGRDGDKTAQFRTKPGVTGVPILLDALSYVEGRVVGILDAEENTIFLADVVAADRLGDGERLRTGVAWSKLPQEWIEQCERNHVAQLDNARRRRGLLD
jgi:flavin reductase (DIM6/NTAB) family NADH-FMN oxidoreductase RutF